MKRKRSQFSKGKGTNKQKVSKSAKVKLPTPDYYLRLMKRQPRALSPLETVRFWQEERG